MRKIYEGDDIASKTMVLMVSSLRQEVTDDEAALVSDASSSIKYIALLMIW